MANKMLAIGRSLADRITGSSANGEVSADDFFSHIQNNIDKVQEKTG